MQYQLSVIFYRIHSLNDFILNIANILPNQYSCQFFSAKPNKTILNFFSYCKVSTILPMQNPHNTFLLIFFISSEIWFDIIIYILFMTSEIWYDIDIRLQIKFPFTISTPFSTCFAVDEETTHSKRILSFFALFNLMNLTIKFFRLFLLIFFEDGRPTTVNTAQFGLLLF